MTSLADKAIVATRESRHIDFKVDADFDLPGTWPEIVKDVVAMANSGGGVIAIGLDNTGSPTAADLSQVLEMDQAALGDQVLKYTGVHWADFEVLETEKSGCQIVLILVGGVRVPLVFTRPGTYPVDSRSQKSAFAAGTVYFRHGAKSEPGNTDDLRGAIDRELGHARNAWLRGVRKVVEAPPGSQIVVVADPVGFMESAATQTRSIRIVDDPKAPAFRKLDYDITHPHRHSDVIRLVNAVLPADAQINSWDIQCVRRLFDVDKNDRFCHRGKVLRSAQYSDGFVEWLIAQTKEEPAFFANCRDKMYESGR